ncbi:MAG: prolyl oligopeptidase family serine peptidase [Lactobacillus sp.]|jgi:dipeptidyl aminopeptidase/acylaminoacyl peptidase|nr:prolyl oligopeptidase family serine peptidase [Lactobacillus sp.]
MREALFLKNNSGLKIAALLDRDEAKSKQGLVILSNGFGGVKDSPGRQLVADLFQDLGYATLRMDNRGRGESEGSTLDSTVAAGLEDLSTLVNYADSQTWVDKDNIGLYGNSYGGGVAVFEAARNPIYSFIIFSSPSVDNKEMYEYAGIIDIKKWKTDGVAEMFGCQRSYKFYEEAQTINGYKEAEKIKCPALILHGDEDEAVPLSQSQRLHKAIANSTLIVLKGHAHNAGKSKEAIANIANWLESLS